MKSLIRLLIFILPIVSILSCTESNDESLNMGETVQDTLRYYPFDSLYLQRKVFTGYDSLELNPFEIYMELELVDVQVGMFNTLVFKTDVPKLT